MDWFVYLSKLLPTLVYPIGLTFVLLAAALFAFKSEKWRLRFLIAAFLILWVTGLPFPGAWLTRSLETTVPPLPADETAAVAVVLGGGTESFEAPRQMVEIGGAGDRILYAAKLYHEGRVGKLLFGGAYFAPLSGKKPSVAAEMADIAERLGVPKEDILIQETSLNTAEEAAADAVILREMDVEKIIVVTSATHIFRAVNLFKKQGFDVVAAPTDFTYSDAEWEDLTHPTAESWYRYVIPQSGNIRAFETAVKEYLGVLMYRIRGWL